MQIVIDMDDRVYKNLMTDNGWRAIELAKAIKNGAPLPKGHGRLIILSEDAVKREQTRMDFSSQKWISEVGLSNATVATIEADKGYEAEVITRGNCMMCGKPLTEGLFLCKDCKDKASNGK